MSAPATSPRNPGADGPARLVASARFREEEARVLRIAVLGKLVVVVVIGLWLAYTYARPNVYFPLAFCAAFVVTGGLMLWARPLDQRWPFLRDALIALDALLVVVAIVTPNPFSANPLPLQATVRFGWFPVLLVVVASTGFTMTPRRVLIAGLSAAAAWAGWSAHVLSLPETVTFAALPPRPTQSALFALFQNPYFFDTTARGTEVITLLLTASLVAAIAWRARLLVLRQLVLEAERTQERDERAFVQEVFGRFVPDAVARAILADRGVLRPEVREATVLFCDIEGFTALGESLDPAALLGVVNDWFEAAGQVVVDQGGTITQFQGDAVLATFNVPLADPDHAANGLRAALILADLADRRLFGGKRLRVRIGVNTGPVIAGAVGGGARQHYTVHGDTVNLAARLEQLNKQYGTRVLCGAECAQAVVDRFSLQLVGELTLRGRSQPVAVHTVLHEVTAAA